MDWEAAAKTAFSVGTPLAAVVGIGSRKRRLRAEIRDNLALIEELRKDEILRDHTPALGWLQGRVAIDVARIAGQPLGARKQPLNWSFIVFAVIVISACAYWAYWLDHDGWVWYSIFPITIGGTFFFAVWGNLLNRDLPAESGLPDGAHPVRTDTAEEQVATAVQMLASGADLGSIEPDGPAGTALEFVRLLRQGAFDRAVTLADDVWLQCRIQARLWNATLGDDAVSLDDAQAAAELLWNHREESPLWGEFTSNEGAQFADAWRDLSEDRLGVASRRRRIAPDYEVVILVPLGAAGGFFVTTATAVPDALTFLMRRRDGRWVVSNHLGTSPPSPGWPPVWWSLGDPAIEALPPPA